MEYCFRTSCGVSVVHCSAGWKSTVAAVDSRSVPATSETSTDCVVKIGAEVVDCSDDAAEVADGAAEDDLPRTSFSSSMVRWIWRHSAQSRPQHRTHSFLSRPSSGVQTRSSVCVPLVVRSAAPVVSVVVVCPAAKYDSYWSLEIKTAWGKINVYGIAWSNDVACTESVLRKSTF